nr:MULTISPECIES: ERCC4 domain-containing protein [unclassified Clostridium]
MQIQYKFTDTEINKLLKENFVILYDTREQVNNHVLDYFDKKNIKYKKQKIDEGDYTAIITKEPKMGIHRDLYFKVAVERKNSVDELASNLGEKTETRDKVRFERELIRAKAKGIKMFLIVEEASGMEHIREGKYRSLYQPKAFIGRLTSIQDQYLQGTIFNKNVDTGFHIYRILYYSIRNYLKELSLDMIQEN